MTFIKRSVFKLFVATQLFAFAAIAHAGDYGKHDKKDIVDTAVAAGQFSTLAAALDAAGLIDTLKDVELRVHDPRPLPLPRSPLPVSYSTVIKEGDR